MGRNDLFEKYLSLAEERAEKFARANNLDEEDVKQDARIILFNVSGKCDLSVYEFEKYLNSALTIGFKRERNRYSAVRCPDYIAPHINYIAKVFNFDKTFEENLTAIQKGLKIKKEEAIKKIEYFLTIYGVNHGESLDFNDFEYACIIEETEQAFNNFFNSFEKEEIERIVRSNCSEKEADVIFRTFGFFGYEENFDEISKSYCISKQRIGQLFKKGMEKLNKTYSRRQLMAVIQNR